MFSTSASTVTMNTNPAEASGAATGGNRRGVRSLALVGCGLVATAVFTLIAGNGPVGASSGDDLDTIELRLPAAQLALPNTMQLGGINQVLPGPRLAVPGPSVPDPGPGLTIPTPIPEFTLPIPNVTIPGPTLPTPGPEPWDPGGIEVVPTCVPHMTDWITAAHSDNGDGTGTAALAYTGPADPCPALIVVHSIQLDETYAYVADLDTQLVSLVTLAAAPGGMLDMVVPMDPCVTRLLTNIEGFTLDDDVYDAGCPTPVDTTTPEDTPDTTTPEDTPETTIPEDTPDDTPPPPNTVPEDGRLPQTGTESVVLAALGAALIILGGTLAGVVRGLQRRS